MQRVNEYLNGAGAYQAQGPGFFKNARSIAAVAGGQAGELGYGMTVRALRITVTVRQGQSSFRLSTVVAPAEGAEVVRTVVADAATGEGTASSAQPAATEAASTPATAVPEAVDLKYPFTFLEIRENDKTVPPSVLTDEPTA